MTTEPGPGYCPFDDPQMRRLIRRLQRMGVDPSPPESALPTDPQRAAIIRAKLAELGLHPRPRPTPAPASGPPRRSLLRHDDGPQRVQEITAVISWWRDTYPNAFK